MTLYAISIYPFEHKQLTRTLIYGRYMAYTRHRCFNKSDTVPSKQMTSRSSASTTNVWLLMVMLVWVSRSRGALGGGSGVGLKAIYIEYDFYRTMSTMAMSIYKLPQRIGRTRTVLESDKKNLHSIWRRPRDDHNFDGWGGVG